MSPCAAALLAVGAAGCPARGHHGTRPRADAVMLESYARHWRHRPCWPRPSTDCSRTAPVDGPHRGGLSVTPPHSAPDLIASDDPFAGYQTEGFFDEMFTPAGEVRLPYRSLVARLRAISLEE